MKNLKFSIDDIELYRDDESVDFAIAKIRFLAVGNNSHNNPISEEVLRQNANTALGKFVIGKFDKWTGDTTTHVSDQLILGYIPPNSEIEFEEKDNKLFAVATAVISKLYASDIYKMFQKDNLRSVSCEFSANMQYDDDEIADGEDNPILGFMVHGITVLGRKYAPSCKGADIQIMQFSEEKAVEFYNTHKSVNSLKQFAEERRKKFLAEKTYKVNKTELKDTAWGGIDKTNLRNKVMNAKNRDKLVRDVYALVEDEWREAPSEHLKYPLMELVGDTFYYNRGALSSALGYAKKENETEVVAKVEKLYKKFKLEEGEDKKMEKKEFSELEGRPVWAEVIKRVHEKLGDHMYVEGVYSDKIVLRNEKTKEIFDIPAKIELGKDDEEMSIEIDYDKMKKSEVQKEFSEKKMDDDKEYSEDDSHSTDEKDDKEVEDDDEDVEEGTKEFSLDANADISAYLEMLENETEEYRELAKKVLVDMESDKGLVMQEYVKMAKERDELKKFKETKEAEAKELEVNRTLMEAKEDLTDEEFTCLKEEGMACKSGEITAFVNKVKAFAYNNAKKNPRKEETSDEHKTYLKMAFDWDSKLSKSTAPKSAEEIYNKYL